MKQPKSLEDAFETVCAEMNELFVKKHKDYGKGNILDTGELGMAFRVNDKLNRIKNLLMSRKIPANETLDESWIDIGVYAVIAIMYRRGWFQKLDLKKK